MTPLVHRVADLMFPLEEFYSDRGDMVPQVEAIDGSEVPAPYRELLVHERDMTSTLGEYYGQNIALRLLEVRRDGDWLRRQVVLLTAVDNQPIEYGAIRIDLSAFDLAAVRKIVECRQPLGSILHACGVEHICRPSAYFRFQSDLATRVAFGLPGPTMLYGRHSVTYDGNGGTLAEVVEILPPIEKCQSA